MPDDYFEFTVRLHRQEMLRLMGQALDPNTPGIYVRTARDIVIEEAARETVAAWNRARGAILGDMLATIDKLRAALEGK